MFPLYFWPSVYLSLFRVSLWFIGGQSSCKKGKWALTWCCAAKLQICCALCLNNLILLHLTSANVSLGFAVTFFLNKMLKIIILDDDVKQRFLVLCCFLFFSNPISVSWQCVSHVWLAQSEDGADHDSPEEGTPASPRNKRRVGRPGRKRKKLLPVSPAVADRCQSFPQIFLTLFCPSGSPGTYTCTCLLPCGKQTKAQISNHDNTGCCWMDLNPLYPEPSRLSLLAWCCCGWPSSFTLL